MKTDTNRKILEFITKKGQTTPKEIIDFIGFSAPAVFRQLKKLLEKGLIQKSGLSPNVFYHLPMSAKERIKGQIVRWVTEEHAFDLETDFYCPTRDIFQARQDKLPKNLIQMTNDEQLSFLLSAVVGEIGNNSFDHNLGNWPDVSGIFFKIDRDEEIIMLADRGQGVYASLKKIKPDIIDDKGALKVAFTEIISGRMPEHRGNGLKFVRRVIIENNLKLEFFSGQAKCVIKNRQTDFLESGKNISGTVAIIDFKITI